MNKIWDWCQQSATIAVQVGAGVFWSLVGMSEVLATPEFKAQLAQVVDAKTLAWIGLAFTVGTVLARMRTLNK